MLNNKSLPDSAFVRFSVGRKAGIEGNVACEDPGDWSSGAARVLDLARDRVVVEPELSVSELNKILLFDEDDWLSFVSIKPLSIELRVNQVLLEEQAGKERLALSNVSINPEIKKFWNTVGHWSILYSNLSRAEKCCMNITGSISSISPRLAWSRAAAYSSARFLVAILCGSSGGCPNS